jgi:hypothetical protein
VLLAGCGRDALEAHRQRWAAERRGLESTLDALEERLLTDQARVRFWQEMKSRHESVTAVACTSLDQHSAGMALFEDKQREKRDVLARKHRVAARFVASPDAR